jgi:Flp pilus assembly pilin Flp
MTARHTGSIRRAAQAARRIASDCSGATAIEYSLLAGMLAVGVVGSARLIGGEVDRLFQLVLSFFP